MHFFYYCLMRFTTSNQSSFSVGIVSTTGWSPPIVVSDTSGSTPRGLNQDTLNPPGTNIKSKYILPSQVDRQCNGKRHLNHMHRLHLLQYR
jgi:hypothetical protein